MVNKQSTNEGLRELALFAGAGGGILGGKLLGWKTVCAVEFDEHARNVLIARQNDRSLEPFPIWDDVRTFDGKPWRGIVDVVSGGFPCQDISAAGTGKGLDGERSGLWSEMSRIIGEVRPRFALVENSPMLAIRGGTRVIADFAGMGYDCKWAVIGANQIGLPHRRERMWIIATDPMQERCGFSGVHNRTTQRPPDNALQLVFNENWREPQSEFCGINNGMAYQMDRLERIGNGQVPGVVATAWKILNAN